jgi:hypothetical protein
MDAGGDGFYDRVHARGTNVDENFAFLHRGFFKFLKFGQFTGGVYDGSFHWETLLNNVKFNLTLLN